MIDFSSFFLKKQNESKARKKPFPNIGNSLNFLSTHPNNNTPN